jgi:hypothetical protein
MGNSNFRLFAVNEKNGKGKFTFLFAANGNGRESLFPLVGKR